jgi:hypothetical protein
MDTRPSSASLRTTLIKSLRRSSVSIGIGTRMTSPMAAGFKPRLESRMAFSTAAAMLLSYTFTPMVRASSRVTFATWLTGTALP